MSAVTFSGVPPPQESRTLLIKECAEVPVPFQNIDHLQCVSRVSKENHVITERHSAHVGAQLRSRTTH